MKSKNTTVYNKIKIYENKQYHVYNNKKKKIFSLLFLSFFSVYPFKIKNYYYLMRVINFPLFFLTLLLFFETFVSLSKNISRLE